MMPPIISTGMLTRIQISTMLPSNWCRSFKPAALKSSFQHGMYPIGWSIPDKDTHRFIPYELYPEVVEIVASWLVTARDQYGVEPDFVSFNEPDVGAYVGVAPFEAIM